MGSIQKHFDLYKKLFSFPTISNVLFEQRDVKSKLFIVVASDKGLCGSFNSNIFKLFNSVSENNNDHLDSINILPVGKKAYDFFNKSKILIC